MATASGPTAVGPSSDPTPTLAAAKLLGGLLLLVAVGWTVVVPTVDTADLQPYTVTLNGTVVLNSPAQMVLDPYSLTVYAAVAYTNRVVRLTNMIGGTTVPLVTHYAGTGAAGYADGPLLTARFNAPYGLALLYSSPVRPSQGPIGLLVSDDGNCKPGRST